MVASTAKSVNKSQLVRDYLTVHPKHTAAQIVDALNKQHPGSDITAQTVYGVVSELKKKKVKAKTSPGTGLVPIPEVKEVEVPEQIQESEDVISRLTPDNFVACFMHEMTEQEVRAAGILLFAAYHRVSQESAANMASAKNKGIAAKSAFQLAMSMIDAM